MQEPSPSGLAVSQYSHEMRLKRSDSSCDAPRVFAAWSTVFQIFSVSCMCSISCARSSRRPNRLKGLRRADMAVCPILAATPSHACCPSSMMTPSSVDWTVTVKAVCPPDCAPLRVEIWTACLLACPTIWACRFPLLNSAIKA